MADKQATPEPQPALAPTPAETKAPPAPTTAPAAPAPPPPTETLKPVSTTSKRALIDKANTNTLIAAGVAAFMLVFCLVSGHAMLSKGAYQNKIISEKKKTLKQVEANSDARDSIVKSYKKFVAKSPNAIGGNAKGIGEKDGDNAKIVLDALPSKYDFPALTSSLEKLANQQGLVIDSIVGTDDEVAQSSQESSSEPEPVPLAFEMKANGAYSQLQGLVQLFEKSIRPIKVQKLTITSSDSGVSEEIVGQTYYQPEKLLKLNKKVVR